MARFFVLIFLVFAANIVSGQNLESRDAMVFGPGEVLKYKIRYGIVTAAEATLQVLDSDIKLNNRPVYHLLANGKTSGSFDVFYKVRNRYDSYIDKETLLPHLYTESIRESNYRRADKARFYQDQNKVVSNKGTFKTGDQTFDIVSAYYFARSLDLANVRTGTKFKMPYFLDDGVSSLEVTYVGKERVKTSLGYFNCLKFSPSIQPGRIFRKDSKLYLWITDDGNRIPVKAQVEILVGTVTMELTSYKGLKAPLAVSKK
ncbi:DUF3108 domain-containing protein [Pedobacter sp. SYSU D00535]|uniref:DUF3108 domain-containing protein n=1 Tax=Pedobacter sp. SYSU D00535 TaxID=2810308 RepID=UPI001A95F116|nr:DUF3108 domain-containing protein [Pedobacter sp. SYSU D00535]